MEISGASALTRLNGVRLYTETYGCTYNAGDTEKIREIAKAQGCTIVAAPAEADAVLINTCVVIEKTEQHMYERLTLFETKDLFITGCLPPIAEAHLRSRYPNAHIIMPDIIHDRLSGDHICEAHRDHLLSLAEESTAVVCGPGLGTAADSLVVAADVVCAAKKAVVDADLLRSPLPRAAAETIYTPHAGEFARVFGAVPEDLASRGETARAAATCAGGVILLKGEVDTISDGRRVRFNRSGASGMTTGGTGDVLAGCAGGLLARMQALPAACAAAYAVGVTGETLCGELGDGLLATDLLRHLAHTLHIEL